MTNVVFDIGNVLIEWDERAPFRDAFPDDAAIDAFLASVDFYGWNSAQDKGRTRQAATEAAFRDWPDAAPLLVRYFERYPQTIQKKIEGSWDILRDLQRTNHRLFALTNWPAEGWPEALAVHPELGSAFEDVVVSGQEALIKPDPRIYDTLVKRNNLNPADCVFIDDSAKNVEAALQAGWHGILFTDPDRLRKSLEAFGVL